MKKAEGRTTGTAVPRNVEFTVSLLVVLSLLPLFTFSQIPIHTYTAATDTFYWKQYTHLPAPKPVSLKKLPAPAKGRHTEIFAASMIIDFPWFQGDSGCLYTPSDLKKHLTPVDINHDGVADVVYTGPGPGTGDIIRFYLGRETAYELVFEDYQFLAGFHLTDKKLNTLSTGDVGEADSPLRFTREYRVEWEGTSPVFIKGKQIVWYRYTEEPPEYYPSAMRFESVADTLMVRASAAILNKPFIPWLESFGNIVARYTTRAEGLILAEKSTPSGTWYFVELWPSSTPSASILYGTDKWPTFLHGWVAGGSIKRR